MEDTSISGVNDRFADRFRHSLTEAEAYNPWFTRDFLSFSFASLSEMLEESKLREWVDAYPEISSSHLNRLNVGIIMAGNIPLVGFHDYLAVVFSGHRGVIKMSSKDEKLLPVVHDLLGFCDPEISGSATLSSGPLKDIDAVIATGSDNSSRYFDYYFGKYPHIIRMNRNSAAVLTGDETPEEYKKLADDIFLYFGMGCRNISKIFIPRGFNIPRMLDNFESYSYLYNHNKYANNYDYHKAIYLVNLVKHYDTGYLLLKEDPGYSSPVGVLYYEYYESLSRLKSRLKNDEHKIQCIVARPGFILPAVPFGKSQSPGLNDYADNADTLKFLLNLYKK